MYMNPQTLPEFTDVERAAVRASLLDRRQRLGALPEQAIGPRVAGLLAQVDAALDRLEGGSFGACIRCEGSVERDRLAADPLTTVCLDCLTDSERTALERDLELASQVQASLLPPRDLAANGWVGHFAYRPHGTVSGDYVDVFTGSGGSEGLYVVVGDVAGKGVAAALLMSHLHAVFRTAADSGAGLVEMVDRANRMLFAATTANAYATLVAAHLESNGAVELTTAGHPPALVLGRSGVDPVATDGLPLGLFRDARYVSRTLRLEPGDGMLLYTDGVTESAGPEGDEFDVPGVRAVLADADGATPRALVERVIAAAEGHRLGHPSHDDVTVMALRRA